MGVWVAVAVSVIWTSVIVGVKVPSWVGVAVSVGVGVIPICHLSAPHNSTTPRQ